MTASTHTHLDGIHERLAQAGIDLVIQKRAVKNINFRLMPGQLRVSAPKNLGDTAIVNAIHMRIDWAIHHHQALQAHACIPDTLWGTVTHFESEQAKLHSYRQGLTALIPTLTTTWQPIVGKTAKSVRLKNMRTRWGSCNVANARIWLSLRLAAYPVMCAHYVFVHELCHLHHANHSPEFWATVARAMPDYRLWHDMLRHKHPPSPSTTNATI